MGQNEIMKIPPLLAIQETTWITNSTLRRTSSKFEAVDSTSPDKGINAVAPAVKSERTPISAVRSYFCKGLGAGGLWGFGNLPDIYQSGTGKYFTITVSTFNNDSTVRQWTISWNNYTSQGYEGS